MVMGWGSHTNKDNMYIMFPGLPNDYYVSKDKMSQELAQAGSKVTQKDKDWRKTIKINIFNMR